MQSFFSLTNSEITPEFLLSDPHIPGESDIFILQIHCFLTKYFFGDFCLHSSASCWRQSRVAWIPQQLYRYEHKDWAAERSTSWIFQNFRAEVLKRPVWSRFALDRLNC